MKCPRCSKPFNSTSHTPFIGACGHSVCQDCLGHIKKKCPQGCWGESFSAPTPNYLAFDLLSTIDVKAKELEMQQEGINEILYDVTKIGKTQAVPNLSHIVGCSKAVGLQTPGALPNKETPILSPKSPVPQQSTTVDPKTILVSNIGGWSLDGLYNWFLPYGTIMSFAFGNKEGINKGSGIVEYASEKQAQDAIFAMHQAPVGFQGQKISVTLNQISVSEDIPQPVGAPKAKLKLSAAVTVRNLGHVTEKQLRDVFEQDGEVLKVALLREDFGKFSGTAYVYFATDESAKKALARDFTKIPNTYIKMTVEPYLKN